MNNAPPQTPDAPQQVIYVERAPEPKNGLAIVAVILGVLPSIFSLIPLTGWLAIMAGLRCLRPRPGRLEAQRKGRATAGKTAIVGTIAACSR